MSLVAAGVRCLCQGERFASVFRYEAPPEGETRFQSSAVSAYHREVLQCQACGHFVSVHEMPTEGLYTGDYVSSTYGDDGIRRAFERITSLDPARSDNVGRVTRVLEFAAQHLPESRSPPRSILDVGSGLCVFLHRMKAAGWDCTALDPDIRSVTHARERVGVRSVCAEFPAASSLGCFDVVTFNKVLEHIKNPVAILANAQRHLKPGGFVYVEVPDGEAASVAGPEREEFFVDHWHIFSAASLALLMGRAGFLLHTLERLREPSGKYTLRGFAMPQSNTGSSNV